MRERIVAGQIYHVLNRGVDKRKIFLEKSDYMRFIHDLFEFNDTESVVNLTYRFTRTTRVVDTNNFKISEQHKRKLLVEILAFCAMPNHYHLLLKARTVEGIPEFMKKLNMGYSKYFNTKYERSGTLFEGRYKSVPVGSEAHFIHLPFYIHLNPLDLVMREWRQRDIKNYKEAMKFLEKYRWSSFLDYIGKKNFPSVTNRDLLLKFFGGTEEYKKSTVEWLKQQNIEKIMGLTLE